MKSMRTWFVLAGLVLQALGFFNQSSPPVLAANVTSTWSTATTGNWNVNANWTNAPALGGSPNNGNGGVATYDAVISAVGSPYIVTLNTNVTVEDLLLNSANATLSHTSGMLTATGAVNLAAGTYSIAGGTIANSTVNATVPINFANNLANTLSGVTVNGDLRFPDTFSRGLIAGGATFSTAHLTGFHSEIGFAPAQTLSGTIQFEGAAGGLRYVSMSTPGSLTVGASGVIKTVAGFADNAVVGSQVGFAFNAAMALTNNGLISSQVSGRTITINPATSFTNNGTLEAISGGILTVPLGYTQTAGTTRLSGGGTISAVSGPTLNTITVAGGRLEGNGTITANVANSATAAVSPGLSAGQLAISGDLTLAFTSALQIEIGGTNQVTNYDFLSEAGTIPLNLAGTLSVTLVNGYIPAATDPLIIVSSNQPLTGMFSNVVAGHVLASDGLTSLRLSVIGNHVVISGLLGDYNHNGIVDTADYVVWRDTLGQTGTSLVADGNHNNLVDAGDYTVWRSNFGTLAGSGSAADVSGSTTVPEPSSILLLGILSVVSGFVRSGRQHKTNHVDAANEPVPMGGFRV